MSTKKPKQGKGDKRAAATAEPGVLGKPAQHAPSADRAAPRGVAGEPLGGGDGRAAGAHAGQGEAAHSGEGRGDRAGQAEDRCAQRRPARGAFGLPVARARDRGVQARA